MLIPFQEKCMLKNVISVLVAVMVLSSAAFAERYVMVTHGEGKDPFWPVVQKGGEDAARAIGAKFEYIYNPSADMADMASSIQAAAATQPDGMVISLPDPDALGPAIKAAVAAGVPVITMNSGLESSASLGALMHVGQPEKLAGQSAGRSDQIGHSPRRTHGACKRRAYTAKFTIAWTNGNPSAGI